MAFLEQVNKFNFNRYKLTRLVYTGWLNYVVDSLNAVFTSATAMKVDTISESTSTAGVTVDGILLKDGGIALTPNVTLYTKEVALTSANLLAMNATPITVVAAPSADYVVDFVSAVLINDDATDYTAGGAITINYGSAGAAVSTTLAATFLTGNGDKVWNLQKLNAAGGYTMPVGVGLTITNASQAFATGTGVCRLQITYTVNKTSL